jgi:hypothetical protein
MEKCVASNSASSHSQHSGSSSDFRTLAGTQTWRKHNGEMGKKEMRVNDACNSISTNNSNINNNMETNGNKKAQGQHNMRPTIKAKNQRLQRTTGNYPWVPKSKYLSPSILSGCHLVRWSPGALSRPSHSLISSHIIRSVSYIDAWLFCTCENLFLHQSFNWYWFLTSLHPRSLNSQSPGGTYGVERKMPEAAHHVLDTDLLCRGKIVDAFLCIFLFQPRCISSYICASQTAWIANFVVSLQKEPYLRNILRLVCTHTHHE